MYRILEETLSLPAPAHTAPCAPTGFSLLGSPSPAPSSSSSHLYNHPSSASSPLQNHSLPELLDHTVYHPMAHLPWAFSLAASAKGRILFTVLKPASFRMLVAGHGGPESHLSNKPRVSLAAITQSSQRRGTPAAGSVLFCSAK